VLCRRHVVPDGTKVMVVTDVAGGLSIYFHPEALPAFSEIAQKLPSTSFIPENLFPSISARYGLQKIRVESCPFSDLKNHSLLLNLHHQSSPADRDYMVLPEVGLAFLRMFSSPNLDDFQREDKLSGEYW
jgi:hypothetical protein